MFYKNILTQFFSSKPPLFNTKRPLAGRPFQQLFHNFGTCKKKAPATTARTFFFTFHISPFPPLHLLLTSHSPPTKFRLSLG